MELLACVMNVMASHTAQLPEDLPKTADGVVDTLQVISGAPSTHLHNLVEASAATLSVASFDVNLVLTSCDCNPLDPQMPAS